MKCDDFLRSIGTGSLWRRSLARLHAARCRRCAAMQAGLRKLENELTQTTPLTDAQRRLWQQAMEAEADERPRAVVRLRLAPVVAVAALVVVSVIAWRWIGNSRDVQPVAEMGEQLPPDEPGPPVAQQLEMIHPQVDGAYGRTGFRREWPALKVQEPPSISLYQEHPRAQSEVSQELAEIRAGLDALSAKLDELSRKVALLKARRQVAELIDRYANLSRQHRD